MTEIFRPPFFQPDSINGVPLAGALLYFYQAGTTTPITVYQDSGLITPHASPVVADASGIFPAIYVNTATYKIVLQTSAAVVVKTYDNIGTTSAGTVFADDVFRVQDNADATRQLAFELSGLTTGTTRTITVPDKSGILSYTTDIQTRNFAYNPQGAISIRTGGDGNGVAISDNAYSVDRWRWIGEATATVAHYTTTSTNANTTNGISYSQTLALMTTNNKGGYFQVLPFRDAKTLRSSAVAFSAALYINDARVGDIRMGIAEWTGSADATTGDPVSSWNAAGTNPTLAAGWAFLNTPSNLSVTTTVAKYTVTANTGASGTNLALMIWCDDKTYNTNDYFSFTQAQLCVGSTTPFFYPRDDNTERAMCEEFAWTTFQTGTVPAQNVGVGKGELFSFAAAAGANSISFNVTNPRRMYKTPTATLYNPAATNAQARDESGGLDCSATTAGNFTDRSMTIAATGNVSTLATSSVGIHALVTAEI